MKTHFSVSALLEELVVKNSDQEYVSIDSIKSSLHEVGFYLLMILFSFPLAFPIPYPPGFTTMVGIPLLFFSVQMLFGYDSPWLPKWIGSRSVKTTTMIKMVNKAIPYFQKIEVIFKPRMSYVTSNKLTEKIIFVLSCIFSAYIILPLILVNHIVGAGVLVMFLAMINKDGLMLVTGIIIGVLGSILATLFVIFGTEAVKQLFHKLVG
jgi:hypothetical protein